MVVRDTVSTERVEDAAMPVYVGGVIGGLKRSSPSSVKNVADPKRARAKSVSS